MPGSKEIRTKIKSVQNTRKITKAMEMVAASKMRKAQDRMRRARPYADKVRNIAAHLSQANPEYRHPFLVQRTEIKAAGLVYSRAPVIVGAHDQGATIRSKDGFWLAIPLPAAGKGPRGKRMTPGLWEKLRGQRLRFIYRRGKPSLLVAENQRARQGQRGGFSAASQKAQASGRGLVTVPMFLLVPQVTLKKKFDIDRSARRWISTLANRIANRFDEADRKGATS